VSRRRLLRIAFWSGVGAAVAGGAATLVNMLYPRGVSGFGGPIDVAPSAIPAPGDPPRAFPEGRFLLVNLAPDEGRMAGSDAGAAGGLLALWTRCPHLGCTVPWEDSAVFNDGTGRRGWFRCPCHGSTYTKAGVRVYGPAPRSMDTMAIEVTDSGIVVQTGDRTKGSTDNTARAIPWTG
jgi:cytochrome b6-f complex iron-sulfur subunit